MSESMSTSALNTDVMRAAAMDLIDDDMGIQS
ncbi:hypothetical protein Xszus_02842 [Xenorhabdus szentirmaii]|uniref:Uncharacterized protein n=1 Tax=Xenorhabdus szentirmaii DSM 16338 TaxID=1427518 RepID=W1J077_9GAMM|nr:hypothetical protein Xsze_00756 [Xenorhabdus szentirmaii DSM 16338]PHM43063.1 hypothetical protein Xszus_02842 [Xenorhabdus szentirmaii]CDL84114.1 hypothetical protein XSR1_40143 [Xenorhabdus szentirmaii DSM 16338]